ncbi:MAG: hypothetical protein QXL96_09595 [Ignisphaera sp.]
MNPEIVVLGMLNNYALTAVYVLLLGSEVGTVWESLGATKLYYHLKGGGP